MPNYMAMVAETIGSLESKAFNVVEQTGEDFVKNVKNEFGFNHHHQRHVNAFTGSPRYGRSIGHRYKMIKKLT